MFPTPRPGMQQPMSGNLGGQHLSRSAMRHRGLFIFAATITGLAAATRYRTAAAIRQNELAQRNTSPEHPNYYVSVDRSGGGI